MEENYTEDVNDQPQYTDEVTTENPGCPTTDQIEDMDWGKIRSPLSAQVLFMNRDTKLYIHMHLMEKWWHW